MTPLFKHANTRALVTYAHDIVMTAISFGASLYMRVGEDIVAIERSHLITGFATLTVIAAIVYWHSGLYQGAWRYASIPDLTAIAKAATLTLLFFLPVAFAWTRLEGLPRSLPFINWFVLMALLGGPRLAYRMLRDRSFSLRNLADGRRAIPVLLIGAGDGAELFIRSLVRSERSEYRVIGIVSENLNRVGRRIQGVPVLDAIENIRSVISDLSQKGSKPQRLILTKDSFDGAVVRDLFTYTNESGISLSRMPHMTEFKSGDPDKMQIRSIDVEDLLGRPQTALDQDSLRNFIRDKNVMITGAGGSIGSELVRQIMMNGPAKIGLLENSEYALYQIDKYVEETYPEVSRDSMIADVCDGARVGHAFSTFRPDVVFHAAALKHVPLVETNCCEGVMVNVAGTVNVANACIAHDVATMVQISTDKAINPTNVMGATKRVAEQYCQALNIAHAGNGVTAFVTVRFGNVLGSTGSVVPLFQKQLENGGPLTVTHKDMTRYFMTVREAVELVLLASAKAEQSYEPDGRIFVLDMGKSVRIHDLAEQMIRLSGYEPGRDIEIQITGCRPGEKLFEEIFHDTEEIIETDMEGVLLATPRAISLEQVQQYLDALGSACEQRNEEEIRQILSAAVPEASLEKTGTPAS